MPIGSARMPLLDHLAELRRRLTIIVVALLISALVVYMATPTIIDILIDPVREFLPNGGKLTVFSALGGFTVRFKVSLFVSAIVCAPIIIWETMAFFLPALHKKERKWVVPTVAALIVLFFIGMIFCYLVIQRAAFSWMLGQTADFATIVPNAEDYLNIMMLLEIGFGIAFELPLLVFYFALLHVVPYKKFRASWRYVYVGFMILSAVVTPDASPATMLFMFLALIGLYEIALLIARQVICMREGKEGLCRTRDEYNEWREEND